MDTWIQRFRQAKAVDGKQVLIPGDPERMMEADRLANGIPVVEPVVKSLLELGERFGVTLAQ